MDELHLRSTAHVRGVDGELGPLMAVVLDPARWTVTHLAVRNGPVPDSGRLVPMFDVDRTDGDEIVLQITRRAFFGLPRFIVPDRSGPGSTLTFAVHEDIPAHHVAVPAQVPVVDRDGRKVGAVSDWIAQPTGELCGVAAAGHSGLHAWDRRIDSALLDTVEPRRLVLRVAAADLPPPAVGAAGGRHH
jgi:hypothetical protein